MISEDHWGGGSGGTASGGKKMSNFGGDSGCETEDPTPPPVAHERWPQRNPASQTGVREIPLLYHVVGLLYCSCSLLLR